jgi:hypothetical protein
MALMGDAVENVKPTCGQASPLKSRRLGINPNKSALAFA